MSFSKFLNFLRSDTGRKVSHYSVGIGAGCTFGVYLYMHTLGLEKWSGIVRHYKHGFASPLTPNVMERIKRVAIDMHITIAGLQTLRFFSVYGFDMFHAGSTKMRTGAIIGLPRNFSYVSKVDIERSDIRVENKPVEWGSEEGELLQDALIISRKAQRFAIAREIFSSDTNYVYIRGFINSGTLVLYYGLSTQANQILQGFSRPRSFRIFLYSIVGTFTFGVWSVTTDILTKYYENYSDQMAASVSKQYAEGGVEYYAKILQRNIALRSLMSSAGERQYTAYGNDVEIIRQRHVPFTVRKENLIKLLSNYNQ